MITKAIQDKFYYAAYSYLDEWIRKDSKYHAALAFGRKDELPLDDGAKCLVDAAKYYAVIRTLKDTGEKPRLMGAYKALRKTEQPQSRTDVVRAVEDFANTLGGEYGIASSSGTPRIPLSAASKFMWMMFRSPIVIYDSIVSAWLSHYADYNYGGYSSYYEVWHREYERFERYVRAACDELPGIKRFTHACDVSDDVLNEWTVSSWFMERVFDHFMLNEPVPSNE